MSVLQVARILVVLGVVFLITGGLIYLVAKTDIPVGRFPGDIRIARDNITCFIPIVTSLLLSIFLTILFNIVLRILNR